MKVTRGKAARRRDILAKGKKRKTIERHRDGRRYGWIKEEKEREIGRGKGREAVGDRGECR